MVAIILAVLPPAISRAAGSKPDATAANRILHVLNRLAFGPSLGDFRRIEGIGVERWIAEQLDPAAIPEPLELRFHLARLDTLGLDAMQLRQLYGPLRPVFGVKPTPEEKKAQAQRARIVVEQAEEARIFRAVLSPRQLQEVMVDFWFNHFNVFEMKGLDRIWIGNYEERAIRPHALGRFRDLLFAVAKHPAMLVYLDNTLNSAARGRGAQGGAHGLNENYAREVMELHTLGVDGGYTQADVIALARALTGWTVNPPNRADAAAAAMFVAARHDFGPKVFLGEPLRASGRAEGEEALDRLARSPATAHHIAFELAQYFVADAPPPALVDRLSARFLSTGGDIRSVLKTLFASPEFWASAGQKYKSPYEFVVSAARASGIPLNNPRPLIAALDELGMPLFGCQTPDGYNNTQEAWLSPAATLRRVSFAVELARGGLRVNGAGDAALAAALPPPAPFPARLADLDEMFGAALTGSTREALAAAAVGLRPALLLGSPDFMRR